MGSTNCGLTAMGPKSIRVNCGLHQLWAHQGGSEIEKSGDSKKDLSSLRRESLLKGKLRLGGLWYVESSLIHVLMDYGLLCGDVPAVDGYLFVDSCCDKIILRPCVKNHCSEGWSQNNEMM